MSEPIEYLLDKDKTLTLYWEDPNQPDVDYIFKYMKPIAIRYSGKEGEGYETEIDIMRCPPTRWERFVSWIKKRI